MWTIIGAPLDSAAGAGEEAAAPAALRDAGLVEALGASDRGDITARIRNPERDPGSGVIGLDDHREAADELATATASALAGPDTPIVLGGDCTLLLGVFLGLARAGLDAGLWLVDGHADFYDGHSSPTGEGADMELSALTGHGPAALIADHDQAPPLDPERTVILGHRRPGLSGEVAEELARVPAEIATLDAPAIVERGGIDAGRWAERALASKGRTWLHVDLDALDEEEFPAVSYPQPEGLDWTTLTELLGPLAASHELLGVSVADFNPRRDPTGSYGRTVVERLSPLLAARVRG